MKKLFNIISLCAILSLCACGGNKSAEDSQDDALSPQERQAVSYVKQNLEKGVKLKDYKVFEEPVPIELYQEQFQSFRNGVFKAGLDYKTNQTRNLEQGMQMAQEKIAAYQEEIVNLANQLREQVGNSNSIIVVGKVVTKATEEVAAQALVVAFNPDTMQPEAWVPVTVPVQNNVGMIYNALNGTLFDYAVTTDHDFKAMGEGVSDPVIKFILDSRAV